MFTKEQLELIEKALISLTWEARRNIIDTQRAGEFDPSINRFVAEQRQLVEDAKSLRALISSGIESSTV